MAILFPALTPLHQLLMLQEDNVGDPKPAERDFLLEQGKFEEGVARYLKRAA